MNHEDKAGSFLSARATNKGSLIPRQWATRLLMALKKNGLKNKWLRAQAALVIGFVLQAGPATAQNLVTNPGFETGDTTGWSAFGSCTLSVETSQVHSGNYACLVTNRTATWNGIAQSFAGGLQSGQTYNVSAWVKLVSGTNQTMQLTMEEIDSVETNYTAIASGFVSTNGWTQLSGQYTFNYSGTFEWLALYAEMPSSANAAYFIDDVSVTSASVTPTNGECTVDWTNVAQRIDGFGASSAWRSSWTSTEADMFFGTNSGTGTSLDGTTNFAFTGIGLSLLRNHIAYASSSSASDTPTTVETNIMQMAQARGALVWSTPWTPAAGFKSIYDIYDTNQATGGGINGGSFLGGTTNQAYASQLANYVASMKNQGINLYAISVQNEPDANVTTYEACQWSGAQIHDFVTNLYNALVAQGLGSTKIIIPESQNWTDPDDLMGPTLNDATAAADVGIIADQDFGDAGTPAPKSTPDGQSVWETAVSTSDAFDGSITNAIYWAGRIHLFMTAAQANAWHYWWLIPGNFPPTVDNEGLTDTNGIPAKRMYALGQFSRFVRPGYYRINVPTNTGSALVSAYKDTNSGNFAIVAINSSSEVVTQTFDFTNVTGISNVTPWITSATVSLSNQTSVAVSNSSFSYALPALSVVTFVGQGITSYLPPTITSQPTNQTVLPGANVTFSVSATGPMPLSYQWRLNGVNIPGATNSSYSITNVQPADGGSYDVLVADSSGVVASVVVNLTVTIAALPFADNFADAGSIYGLSGVGSGSNTNATREVGEPNHADKYGTHSVWLQWTAPANGVATFNTRGSSFDTLLAVYTGTSLSTLAVVAANDDEGGGRLTSLAQFNVAAGTNYLIAVDGLGSANGDIVLAWDLVANVVPIPTIVTQPGDVTVLAGGTASFSVVATSNTNLTYQWYFNDTQAILGATNDTLTISNVGLSQVGLYRANVTSAAGPTVVSDEASLEIGLFPGAHSFDKLEDLLAVLWGQESFASMNKIGFLAALDDTRGGFASVAAGSVGQQDISLYDATTSLYEPVQTGMGGADRWWLLTNKANCTLVIDTIGSTDSKNNPLPTLLSVYTLSGTGLFSYQLSLVARNQNGAPDGIHSLVQFAAQANTNYLIQVDAVSGVAGVVDLNWKAGIPPSGGGSGQSQAVGQGATLTLQADTNAIPAPSYWWLWDGANIAGATNATYSLTNIQYNQGGVYSVVVSNFVGVVTNVIATVSVQSPLQIALTRPSGVLNFQLTGSATQAVVLQGSTNLKVWYPILTNTDVTMPVIYLQGMSTSPPSGFFRLVPMP